MLLCTGPTLAQPLDFSTIDPADHAQNLYYLETTDGKPTGYWHTTLQVKPDGSTVAGFEHYRVEKHGGERSTKHDHIVWHEDPRFTPKTITLKHATAQQNITRTFHFVEDGVEMLIRTDEQKIRSKHKPIQGAFYSYAQHIIAFQVYAKQATDTFTFNTFDPRLGWEPYTTSYKRSKKTFDAEAYEGWEFTGMVNQVYHSEYSTMPGFVMTTLTDKDGKSLGFYYHDPIGREVRALLADKSVKKIAFDPPESQQTSVVVPNRAINHASQLDRAVYELSYAPGPNNVLPMATAHQRVERVADNKVRITIDLHTKADAGKAEQDNPNDAHLAHTTLVDAGDAGVRRLAQSAVKSLKEDASQAEIANACKRAVSAHMTNASLAIADGSATQAAQTGKGDCTESAVLLAAMLRAHDIPSRCVTGLVYSETFGEQRDVFVFHMWTQAWVQDESSKGHWIDLDPTRWRYSPAHIALGHSAMDENNLADKLRLLPMMNGLGISVIETSR